MYSCSFGTISNLGVTGYSAHSAGVEVPNACNVSFAILITLRISVGSGLPAPSSPTILISCADAGVPVFVILNEILNMLSLVGAIGIAICVVSKLSAASGAVEYPTSSDGAK